MNSGTVCGYVLDSTPTIAEKHCSHCRMSVTGPTLRRGQDKLFLDVSSSFNHVSVIISLISSNSNRTIFWANFSRTGRNPSATNDLGSCQALKSRSLPDIPSTLAPSVGTFQTGPPVRVLSEMFPQTVPEDAGNRGSRERDSESISRTFLFLLQPCLRHEVSHFNKFQGHYFPCQPFRDGQQTLTHVTPLRQHCHGRLKQHPRSIGSACLPKRTCAVFCPANQYRIAYGCAGTCNLPTLSLVTVSHKCNDDACMKQF